MMVITSFQQNNSPFFAFIEVIPLLRLHPYPRKAVIYAEAFKVGVLFMAYTLKAACESLGYKRTPNLAACRELLT